VLAETGLLHANPAAVRASLFTGGGDFFLPQDKVQVKYEMLRAHLVDGRRSPTLRRLTATRGRRSTWCSHRSPKRG
jgi:hypothetical protein